MRVLVCDPGYPLELVREYLPGAEAGAVADAGAGVVALLTSPDTPVRAADIGRMLDLAVIATASVGFDHIDVAAAQARGIAVRNVPDYCVEEVADHALAMIVALRRGLVASDRAVQSGRWEAADAGTPRRLASTRLAVIAMGRIGRRLAEKAQALEMQVRWHDPHLPGGEPDLDALLRWAEAVSLHAPLTPETEGMIDARRLGLLAPGTILVNTARGGLVDREALRRATHLLTAFDTLWERPPAADLIGLPHLMLTPYVAWYSPETELEPYRRAAAAVAELLADTRLVS